MTCLPSQYFLLGIAMCSAYINGATIKGTGIVSAESLMENRTYSIFAKSYLKYFLALKNVIEISNNVSYLDKKYKYIEL